MGRSSSASVIYQAGALMLLVLSSLFGCFWRRGGDARSSVETREPAQALVPYLDNASNTYGYMDESGRTRILPRFGSAGEFAEGRAFVRLGDKAVVIDIQGNVVFETAGGWDPDTVFHDGRIAIAESRPDRGGESAYSVYDANGRIAFVQDGWQRPDFREGLAAFRSQSGYGFVDVDGRVVIEPHFSSAGNFSEGLADVDLRTGLSPSATYIDKQGRIAIQDTFYSPTPFSEGLAYVGGGFIDKTGQMRIKTPDSWRPSSFSEGLALVEDWTSDNRKVGFIDKTGAWAIRPELSFAESFHEGLAVAWREGAYGYIDKSGRWVIAPSYSRAESFKQGVARVQVVKGKHGGGWHRVRAGYIDAHGKWLRHWEEDLPPPLLQ